MFGGIIMVTVVKVIWARKFYIKKFGVKSGVVTVMNRKEVFYTSFSQQQCLTILDTRVCNVFTFVFYCYSITKKFKLMTQFLS